MAKRASSTIMVAVRTLDDTARPLLRKAAAWAARLDATSLSVVHVIALPYGPMLRSRGAVRAAGREEVQSCREKLSQLVRMPELRGLETQTLVSWDYPAAEGLVRAVLRRRPRLLIAESHRHSRLARVWLSNTDWELIRTCPCPVWFSKSKRADLDAPVLAAVDPLHAHAKPLSLDDAIVRQAIAVSGARLDRVFISHAYEVAAPVPNGSPVEAYWLALNPAELEDYEVKVRKATESLRRRYDVPPQHVLIARGDPAVQLPKAAKKIGAGVVVMGAVSRSGLKRLFIGHTAQRVIDDLSCDVLVVKPRGFKTPVPRYAPVQAAYPPL